MSENAAQQHTSPAHSLLSVSCLEKQQSRQQSQAEEATVDRRQTGAAFAISRTSSLGERESRRVADTFIDSRLDVSLCLCVREEWEREAQEEGDR